MLRFFELASASEQVLHVLVARALVIIARLLQACDLLVLLLLGCCMLLMFLILPLLLGDELPLELAISGLKRAQLLYDARLSRLLLLAPHLLVQAQLLLCCLLVPNALRNVVSEQQERPLKFAVRLLSALPLADQRLLHHLIIYLLGRGLL